MKYILLTTRAPKSILIPILFGNDLVHSEVAALHRRTGQVTSAGFVEFVDDEPHAFGRSDSLNIESHPEDSEIIFGAFLSRSN